MAVLWPSCGRPAGSMAARYHRAMASDSPTDLFPATRPGPAVDAYPLQTQQIALGIRQPWIELILRGLKTLEIRTQPTNVRGPVYLYMSKTVATIPPAEAAIREHGIEWDTAGTQRLVGQVDIVGCRRTGPDDAAASALTPDLLDGLFAWELARPVRFIEPVKPRFLPYGVWFYPFRPKR